LFIDNLLGGFTMKANRVALVLLVLAWASAPGIFAQEQEAEVVSVSGTVEIQRAGAEKMLKAEPGMKGTQG
jgi:hypothetical protein